MRIFIGILMALHGAAHMVGFVAAWNLAPQSVPYRPITLLGAFGHNAMRMVGLMWGFAAVAFIAAGIATLQDARGWEEAAMLMACASLMLCILAWPDARIGAYVNIGLVLLIQGGRAAGWV